MRLKEYLREGFVVTRLEARDVEGVLDAVARRAEMAGVAPAEAVAERLLERERVHPTVMGGGLALPHATVPGLGAPALGVAVLREPVPFGAPEEPPVRVLFILLSPPGLEREHVKLLARICRLARHGSFIDRLEAAPDEAALLEVIETVDAEHP